MKFVQIIIQKIKSVLFHWEQTHRIIEFQFDTSRCSGINIINSKIKYIHNFDNHGFLITIHPLLRIGNPFRSLFLPFEAITSIYYYNRNQPMILYRLWENTELFQKNKV